MRFISKQLVNHATTSEVMTFVLVIKFCVSTVYSWWVFCTLIPGYLNLLDLNITVDTFRKEWFSMDTECRVLLVDKKIMAQI